MLSIIAAHCEDLTTWQSFCLLYNGIDRDYFILSRFKRTNNTETVLYNETEGVEMYYDAVISLYHVKNGLTDGKFISFYKNGSIATKCTFKKGKREGYHYLYDEDNGKLLLTSLYFNAIEKEIFFNL